MSKKFLSIIAVFAIIPTIGIAHADGPITKILGDATIHLTLMVIVVCIVIKAIYAILKYGWKNIDVRLTVMLLMIPLLILIATTATSLSHLPKDAEDSTYLVLIVGEVFAIMETLKIVTKRAQEIM